MEHWNLDIIGYWVIVTACLIEKDLKLSPGPSKFSKLLPCLHLSIGQVWWLNDCGSKDIFKNAMILILILIMTSQIWQIMGWFEIQKLEYLENGTKRFYKIKKFLTLWLIWHIFRSYRFAVKVNIKRNYWVKFLTMTNHNRTLFYELTSFTILWII